VRNRALLALEYPQPRISMSRRSGGDGSSPSSSARFLLVLVAAGGGVVAATSHGAVSRAAAVTAPGLMVMAIILFMGAVSGAHLNPAVTISFWLRGDFPRARVVPYVVVQLAGAVLACLFVDKVIGGAAGIGATLPGAHVADWKAALVEGVLTVGLVSTILAQPRARRTSARSRRLRSRLHRARRTLVEPAHRRVDEPGALVRPGSDPRRLRPLLAVSRRPSARWHPRGRHRVGPARAGG